MVNNDFATDRPDPDEEWNLPHVYLAGPMTGEPDFNYPRFHNAAADLRAAGYVVTNPAENFDGDQSLPWQTYLRTAVQQVAECGAVAFLPGWQDSRGARLEEAVADGLGLTKYLVRLKDGTWHLAPFLAVVDDASERLEVVLRQLEAAGTIGAAEDFLDQDTVRVRLLDSDTSILAEAEGLVNGPRQGAYGHPIEDFTRTGRLWGAILGTGDVDPHTVALMMVALKLSREVNKPKRDNRVDAAGYLLTAQMVLEARGRA